MWTTVQSHSDARAMATVADEIEELNNSFLNFMLSPEDVEKATAEIYDDLVNEVLMGFVFDAHRRAKCGITDAEEGIEDDTAFNIVDGPGLDVFGEPIARKTGKCKCPNCDQVVTASRFATHLERCLGMGRNSSRLASQRISRNVREQSSRSGDENDEDWRMTKKRKHKRGRKAAKRANVSLKDDSDDVSTSNSPPDSF